MTTVEAAASAAFDRRLDPRSSAPVAVAVSGGGDSIALLWLAAAWAHEHGRPLLAVHVDHGLNARSKAWAGVAAEAARRAAAGFLSLEWRGPKPATGLPAAARDARHRLLANAAREAGVQVLLTGHTRDDVEEGERMRADDVPALGRLRDWSPSPAWPEGRGLFLLRPLLEIRREALRDWLRARSEPWIEDPANEDLRFARSRARAFLSSSSEDTERLGPRVCGSSSLRPKMTDFSLTTDGRVLLPRTDLDAAFLSAALLCAAGTDRPPRSLQVERLLERLAGDAAVDATLAGARLMADAQTVQIGRDAGERFRGGLTPLDLAPDTAVVWDGRFEILADTPGLRVAPLGGVMAAPGRQDRARLKPIPAWARGALPALTGPDGGVSLPRPLGDGPAQATSLAGARLAGACGLIARETEIDDPAHGAGPNVTLCSGPRT